MTAPFLHPCHCGAWGSFGTGHFLRDDSKARWYCRDHRPAAVAREPLPPVPATPVVASPSRKRPERPADGRQGGLL